ncbi:MAG: HAD superfamily hydrolase (TIGR01509 family) [Zhongshania sp.]|jgi:HAD superfamily hydrolase (TIGR01509 family)
MLTNIRAVLFDLDGTLIDSGLDFQQLRQDLGWPAGIGLLEYMAAIPCSKQRAEAASAIHEFEMRGAVGASWMPGARELILRLQAAGIATGILTRNSRPAYDASHKALGIPITDVITREDAPAKPNPAGLLLLAERVSVKVESAIYVGDFVYDLQAARAAGMRSCLYDTSGESEFSAQADICVQDFKQLASIIFP